MRIVRGVREKRSLVRAWLSRWPFLLACALLGALLTGVILMARPPLYVAQVEVTIDPFRYDLAVQELAGRLIVNPALAAEARAVLAERHPADLSGAAGGGEPFEFAAAGRGTLRVVGRASSADRAAEIAAHGGQALVQALQSMRGWRVLQVFLRQEVFARAQGAAEPTSSMAPYLLTLLDAGFLTYDPAIPIQQPAAPLFSYDMADVLVALQRSDDHLSAQINALFAARSRESDAAERQTIDQELASLTTRREKLRQVLLVFYRRQEEWSIPREPDVMTRSAAGPALQEPVAVPRGVFLGIGAAAGLFLGAVLAYFDETDHLVERLREVFGYRELIWNLVLRDLKARYKSSVLGYLWSLVNPLLMMGVFTVLFKYLLKSPIPNFPVFIIVGLLPWNFCTTAVSGAVVSITGQSALIKKVYFPREAIPIALVIANLINFLLALPAMIAIMLVLNAHLQPVALLFPAIVLIQTIFLLGLALFLSSLNVFFRDTQVIMDVLLLAWFFLTPVFYRLGDVVPQYARLVRWLNPMASLIDFYRDIFYLGGMPGLDALVRTLVTALLVLLVGYLFFLRLSPRFGEEV